MRKLIALFLLVVAARADVMDRIVVRQGGNITNVTAVSLTGSLTNVTLFGTTTYGAPDKSYVGIAGDYGLGLSYVVGGTPYLRVSTRSVQTIASLTNDIDPLSVNLFATVDVHRYADGDVMNLGGGKFYRTSSTGVTVDNRYKYFPSLNPSWVWARVERDTVNAAEYGIFGAPNEEQNLITGNDVDFSSDEVDPAWSGFGDAQMVTTLTSGTGYTWGIYSIPESSSAFVNRKNIYGYARCIGVAAVPPGGTVAFRMTGRGHGYTSGSTQVLTLTGDGTGGLNASIPIQTNSFRDGYITNGKLHLITQGATSPQEIVMGFYAPTHTGIGGLLRPLQIGRTYRVTLDAQRTAGTALEWYAGTSTNTAARVLFTPGASEGTHTGTFVADGPLVKIGLYNTASTGQEFTLDNIVIAEVSLDGPTSRPPDEYSRIATMLLNSPGKDVKFGPNRRYYSTRGLRIDNGQRVDGQGSWIEIAVGTNRDDGLVLYGKNPEVRNFSVTYSASAPLTNEGEGAQNIVSVGHFQYYNYPIAENAVVENMVLRGYGMAQYPMAIVVTGSRNTRISNIVVPDNAGLRQALGIYWQGELTQHVGTERPVGVTVENVRIGALTASDTYAVTVGSAAGVSLRNIFGKRLTGSGVRITTGDIGWQELKPDLAGLVQSGVLVENCIFSDVTRAGFRVQNTLNYVTDNAPIIHTNAAVTFDPATDSVLLTAHGLHDGTLVRFSGTTPPSGISFATNYYVTWSSVNAFKLRATGAGYGNGAVVDIGAGAVGVTATAWRLQEFTTGPVEFRNCYAKGNATNTLAGIYFDGCQDVTLHNVTVDGFRWGSRIDESVANRNLKLVGCSFLNSKFSGAELRAGYNITYENCYFSGNGTEAAGAVDTSAGLNVTYGRRLTVDSCVFGDPNVETYQGHAVFVDNGNADLMEIALRDNFMRSSTKTSMFRLDDSAITFSDQTFREIRGNSWADNSGVVSMFQTTAVNAAIPAVQALGKNGPRIFSSGGRPFDVMAATTTFGADDSGGATALTRTDLASKNTVLASAGYTNSGPAIQFARLESTSNNSTLYLGHGLGGSTLANATIMDFYTAPSLIGSGVARGRVNSSGRWSIGNTATENAVLVVNSTDVLARPAPRLTAAQIAAAAKIEGGMFYDDTVDKYGFYDGSTEFRFAYSAAALTSGRVPVATTNGALADDADITFSGDTLTVTKVQPGSIELGHASDTTLARSAAGVVTIEGLTVLDYNGTPTTGQIPVFTNGAWSVMSPGASGIGGSTGSTDNSLLRADGTGGATLQSSAVIVDDYTSSTANNVAIRIDDGSTANISAVVTPKGNGAFILGPKPDGTATGGNARGQGAVDLSLSRAASYMVAAGNNSFVAGKNAWASAADSAAIGDYSSATALAAYAFGRGSTASGNYSAVIGGYNATASGQQSAFLAGQGVASATYAVGAGEALANLRGQFGLSGGSFAAGGDSQSSMVTVRNSTASTSATVLFTDGSSGRLTLANNSAWTFEAQITGITSGAADTYSYRLVGVIRRGANAASTTMPTTVTKTVIFESNAAADVDATANTTSGALDITVTAANSTTTRWSATVVWNQVGF